MSENSIYLMQSDERLQPQAPEKQQPPPPAAVMVLALQIATDNDPAIVTPVSLPDDHPTIILRSPIPQG